MSQHGHRTALTLDEASTASSPVPPAGEGGRPQPQESGVRVGLSAPFVLEYVYKRSLGPVIGRFCTSLRDGRIEGIRTASGRVVCPPTEYDPESGEALTEFVQVGPGGTVLTWAWVSSPRHNHPLDRPFAWALVRLDGADTGMLHVVDAGSEERMAAGMRVQARFRAQRGAGIRDIECFEPEGPAS